MSRPHRRSGSVAAKHVQTLATQKTIRLSKTATRIADPACVGPGALEGHFRISFAALRRSKTRGDGGADRDRTDDLRLAKPALSQLSYSPSGSVPRDPLLETMLPTCFSLPAHARRLARTAGGGACWWAWIDSNYRPPAYQADALTN